MLLSLPSNDPDLIINRLIVVLATPSAVDPHRLVDMGAFLGFAVGGKPAEFSVLSAEPLPGTVAARMVADGLIVSSEEWLEMLRTRLLELVAVGIDPLFLVRSLVHMANDHYASMADTGTTDAVRERSRQRLLESANDPDEIDRYRSALAEAEPDAGELSDDEIAHRLRRLHDKLPQVSPDEAVDRWAHLEAWRNDSAFFLALD